MSSDKILTVLEGLLALTVLTLQSRYSVLAVLQSSNEQRL